MSSGKRGWEWAAGCRPQFTLTSLASSQATTERVLKAGKLLHRHLLATYPTLIRDRKYHLRLYR